MVRNAVDAGADALAMAGGDGSQAVVAKVAAELDLPYACIPAGTRNHFALDLGVDRDDVVGALDAFVTGAGERRVDLAEVNGQVFCVRAGEIVLFSLPRPIRAVHKEGGWTPQSVADVVPAAFKASFVPNQVSSDIFPYEPLF